MRIVRHNERVLMVDGATMWIALLCGVVAAVLIVEGRMPEHHGILAAGCLFLGCAALTARSTRFTFDAETRTVRWRLQRLFLGRTGSLAFNEIEDVATESATGGGTTNYRLVLLFGHTSVPMDFSYTADLAHLQHVRAVILSYVRPSASAEEATAH